MCSFDTTEDDIDAFLAAIARETADPGPEPRAAWSRRTSRSSSARSEAPESRRHSYESTSFVTNRAIAAAPKTRM